MKALISCALWSIATLGFTAPAGTEFTYQGLLSFQGTPAEGSFDFRFSLFDAESGGATVGSDLMVEDHPVSGGVFTVTLDFGADAFMGEARWLEVDVREGASNGSYTTLSPRKPVTASPFALDTLFILPNSVDTAALQDNAVTQSKLADNSVGTSQIQNNSVSSSDIRDGTVAAVDIGTDAVGSMQIASNSVGSDEILDGSITPDDVDGALYSRKGRVQYHTATDTIGFGIQRVTVTCAGARDIPVVHVCNVPSDVSALTVLSERLTSLDAEVNPARLVCSVSNRSPTNPETLTATIGCIPVD